MRKFTYLATMLLVMAGAVSCKKNADVEPTKEASTRTVRIAVGSGTEKTSMSGAGLTWSENDKLYIVPADASLGLGIATLNIVSGVGETSAVFEGEIDSKITDNTPIYGFAGGTLDGSGFNVWDYWNGQISNYLTFYQYYVENGIMENLYLSIGKGTIKEGMSLHNPFGILCLNIKGLALNASRIELVSTSGKNLCGPFIINPETLAVSGGNSNTVEVMRSGGQKIPLSSEGTKIYFVCPPSNYVAEDLKVTVVGENYVDYITNLGATTISANHVTTVVVDNLVQE